ncbi:MAG: T9SS type A sorting domain-containing protein [candidate division Zixibacteria bacterium]|nr:T9SS type A sorting domain-containing protein [candidate division Zixibacteria bacterium]
MKKGFWSFALILFGWSLRLEAEVAVLPASGVVDRTEPYRILLSDVPFPAAGKVRFEFSEEFSLKAVRSVKAFVQDGSPNDFKLSGFRVSGQAVEVRFENRSVLFFRTVVFELKEIRNPRRARKFQAEIFVFKEGDEAVLRFTAPFFSMADKAEKLFVAGPADTTVRAGRLVEFSAAAEDRFGNSVTGTPVEWKIASGSNGNGTFLGNRFFATRAGEIEVLAVAGELVSAPVKLGIAAGELEHFEITGTPDSTVAGVPFPGGAGDSIVVTAKDQFGDTVADFSGTVSFSSDDPLAVLPAPYLFTTGGSGKDDGRHAFPGSQFALKRAGTRKIFVSADGKTGASPHIRVAPNYLADFFFFAPPEVIAGKAFDATVAGGIDLYGNPASGTVNVVPVQGGGPSPNGAVSAFSAVVVTSGTGKSAQTLVATAPTVLRGTNGFFSTFSDTIVVRPAALGGFSLLLSPDTLAAGDTVSTFSVEVQDRFGNLKTDFTGSGYLSSSDSRAILQYSGGNPYSFSSSDAGRHIFPGGAVKFLSRGTQTLTFGNDSIRSSAASFLVLPGPPVSFSVSAPSTVTAGASFQILIQNAKDAYDNPVSLFVQVGLKSGSGISPSGDGPVLPVVSITDGSGQGPAVLPKAEKAVLEGISGSLRFSSDTVLVSPAGLEKFEWNLSSPQISGLPFSAPAALAAKDRFGNLKYDFDASAESVFLASQPAGAWEKNVLKQSGDFVSGTANLTALGVTFFGPANTYVFSAVSAGGKTGTSAPVEVQSVFVDSFSLAPSDLIRGQNFYAAFRVANQSAGPFTLDGVKLLSAGRALILSLPALPDTLVSSGTRSYSASASLPEDFPLGKFPIQLELSGRFGAAFANVKTPVLDSLAVADSLFLRPSAEGLNFERVSKGRRYPFSIKLVNQSNFDVVLDSATRLVFSRAGVSRTFLISDVTLVPQAGEGAVLFRPDSFPSAFSSGVYSASLAVSGRRDGASHSDSFSLGDSVLLENPSRLYYVAGSLSPQAALFEMPLNVRLQLGNNGQAAFQADTLSQLILAHGSDSLFGNLQPATPIVAGPPVELNFWVAQTSNPPPKGIFNWRPFVKLSGVENGLAADSLLTVPDSITLFPQPSLILDSLWAVTSSPNRVNSDRSFPIRVRLSNPSAETLLATWLYLKEGNTQITSLLVPYLAPQETVEKSLTVAADSNRLGSIPYQVEIVPGYGAISSAPAELTLKMNQITVLHQRKAILELLPEIVAPPSARGGVLVAGQTLTVATKMRNLGEAPTSAGRVRLKVVPPFLTFISDSNTSVSTSQPAVFQLLAQDRVDSGRLVAAWSQIPNDSNTAAPAEIVADSVELLFKILPARVALTVSAKEKPGPLLYAEEWTTPFELGFTNIDASGTHLFLVKKVAIGLSGLRTPGDISAFDSAVLSDGVHSATAVLENSRLAFVFSPPALIGPGETRVFSLSVRPEMQLSQSLRFYTNGDLIEARDSVPGAGTTPALLLKADGQPFEYTSSVFTAASGAGLAASLITYPNPFSPPAEKIQIAYRLLAASEVELKIYTLTGELVTEKTYASGTGVNQIEWDGTNGRGETVKNGVYIAVVRSKATGETVRQKLAVVK